jgi:hypothetical protein
VSRWFRMYSDALDDPKVQRLPGDLFKAWVNLLCLANRNDGVLPCIEDIAFALRMSQDVTVTVTTELVARGLLDDHDGLAPHNWAERQFKSDTPESAAERKRAQRAREKTQEKPSNVTPDVTECHSDSHSEVTPPEQNRADTEQNITKQTRDCVVEPAHREVVQNILDHHDDQLDHWKREFLISIKWRPTLTRDQQNSLDAIRELTEPRFGKDKPLPSVRRGTPAYDAWIAHYRVKANGKSTFYEKLDVLTVPSEFPPQEKAA